MPDPTPTPALFDLSAAAPERLDARLVRVPLEALELAPNQRREIPAEGIERLAGMLCRTGQLVPCIGHRPDPDSPRTILYAGQRRLLAARASQRLAGHGELQGLAPVASLVVLLLDHAPAREELRRIQAQENAREALTLVDQQAQFADCWAARAGLPEPERIAAVCVDLGIAPRRAHNLRRQLSLPAGIRERVAERPEGAQLSATLANRLAELHAVAPALAVRVAERVSGPELHERALADLGAFVHRTLLEDETAWAARIDEGARLDCHAQLAAARAQLGEPERAQLAGVLGVEPAGLDAALDALAAKARASRATLVVDAGLRERARAGAYAFVAERGRDFAPGIWICDPVFAIDALREPIEHADAVPATDPGYFAGAQLHAPDLARAAEEERERRATRHERQAQARASNLGFGHDRRAGLLEPSPAQLEAVKTITCRLLARHAGELIALGAGWSEPEHQHPVGERGRREPRSPDTVTAAVLERALAEPDPLRAITGVIAAWASAFALDPDGLPRAGALGAERLERRQADALPAGPGPLRDAVWALLSPLLSPRLIELHRDAFLAECKATSTVDLTAHRGDSALEEIELGQERAA